MHLLALGAFCQYKQLVTNFKPVLMHLLKLGSFWPVAACVLVVISGFVLMHLVVLGAF